MEELLSQLSQQFNVDQESISMVHEILPHVSLAKVVHVLASFGNNTDRCIEYLLGLDESELNDEHDSTLYFELGGSSLETILPSNNDTIWETPHNSLNNSLSTTTTTTTSSDTYLDNMITQEKETPTTTNVFNEETHALAIMHNQTNCALLNLAPELQFLFFNYLTLDVVYMELPLVCQLWNYMLSDVVTYGRARVQDQLHSLSMIGDLYYMSPRFIEKYVAPNCSHLETLDLPHWYNIALNRSWEKYWQHIDTELISVDSDDDDDDGSNDPNVTSDFAPSLLDNDGQQQSTEEILQQQNVALHESTILKMLQNAPRLKNFHISNLTKPMLQTLIQYNPLLENVSLHNLRKMESMRMVFENLNNLRRIHFLSLTSLNYPIVKKHMRELKLTELSILVIDAVMPPNELATCLQSSLSTLESLFLFDYMTAEAQMTLGTEPVFDLIMREMDDEIYRQFNLNKSTIYTLPKCEVAFFGAYPVCGGIDRFHFPNLKHLIILSVSLPDAKEMGSWLFRHSQTIEEFVFMGMNLSKESFRHMVPAIRKMKKFCIINGYDTSDSMADLMEVLFDESIDQPFRPDFELYIKMSTDVIDDLASILQLSNTYLKGLEVRSEVQAFYSKKIAIEKMYSDKKAITQVFFNRNYLVLSNVDGSDLPDNLLSILDRGTFRHLEFLYCGIQVIGEFFQLLPILQDRIDTVHIAFSHDTLQTFQESVADIVTEQILQSTTNSHQNSSLKNTLGRLKYLKITAPFENNNLYFLSLLAFMFPEVTHLTICDRFDENDHENEEGSINFVQHGNFGSGSPDLRKRLLKGPLHLEPSYALLLDTLAQFTQCTDLSLELKTSSPSGLIEAIARKSSSLSPSASFRRLQKLSVYCMSDPFLCFNRRSMQSIRRWDPSFQFKLYDVRN